jgi:uncharacterized membrane protein (DUF485 family)
VDLFTFVASDTLRHEESSVTASNVVDPPARRVPTAAEFQEVQDSPQFQDLRRRLRTFVFPMTAFFLTWYGLYVVMGIYATGFMGTKVVGNINIGLLFGLGQFVTTFGITAWYIRFANRELDPKAAAIRAQLEGADK